MMEHDDDDDDFDNIFQNKNEKKVQLETKK